MKLAETNIVEGLRTEELRLSLMLAEAKAEREAAEFAVLAHGHQMYGDVPYVHHLRDVRQVVAAFGFQGSMLVAAWLHDVVEDTETRTTTISARFGSEVARLVWAVTGTGLNRQQRNQSVYAKVGTVAGAADLKVADRIANVTACMASHTRKLRMYLNEGEVFREAMAKHCLSTILARYDGLMVEAEQRLERPPFECDHCGVSGMRTDGTLCTCDNGTRLTNLRALLA